MKDNDYRNLSDLKVTLEALEQTTDWAAAYPVPERSNLDIPPSERSKRPKHNTRAHECSEDEAEASDGTEGEDSLDEFDDDEYEDYECDMWDMAWCPPRMACKLFHGVLTALENWESNYEDMRELVYDDFPPCAEAYINDPKWFEGIKDCGLRVAARLVKGLGPAPNCTGEEMVMHIAIKMAEECVEEYIKEDPESWEEYFKLPRTRHDDKYDMVAECAAEDADVMMLFDKHIAAGILDASSSGDNMMDFANIHPKDWFLPFKRSRVRDHLGPRDARETEAER
mmetsp:Transcript_2953/g.6464  ORF Transcript_2953/g.6464 Transcript_2953/m.6464 type:complete len:283 (+) Transcript_2953:50-898(+)